MADGSFPTLVSKDTSANAVTNPIWVELTDGTSAVNVTSNALDVNIAGGSIIIDFSFVDDSAFTVATDKIGAVGMLANETSPDSVNEGDIGIPRMTLDRKQLIVVADASTDANRLTIDENGYITSKINGTVTVDANSSNVTVDNEGGASAVNIQDGGNSITVDATALDIRTITKATDSIQISRNTSANSETNPIFVQNVETAVSGTEVHHYATTVDTGNNDYTVAGSTFLLRSVIFGASGGMKAEIQVGPIASLVTVAVGFIPHQGGMNQIIFDPPVEVPATSTGTVRVAMTNREGSNQSLYSTIIGNDIP